MDSFDKHEYSVPDNHCCCVVMDAAGFAFAVLPPALAIAVERLNPINESTIRTSAERDFKDFHPGDRHHDLLDYIAQSSLAAVEVSGLAPTLVAAITSGFAIIHELSDPFAPAVGYVVIVTVIILGLMRLLGGWTFFEINSRRWVYTVRKKEIVSKWTRAEVVSRAIYSVNFLIIILAVAIALSGANISSIETWILRLIAAIGG